MTIQTLQIPIPTALLQRARISALQEASELITFLLEHYIQELEQKQLHQAYLAYYNNRTPQDMLEEKEIMNDFAYADTEIEREADQ